MDHSGHWSRGSYNAGIILGTHQRFGFGEVEGVLSGYMAKCSEDHYESLIPRGEVRFITRSRSHYPAI